MQQLFEGSDNLRAACIPKIWYNTNGNFKEWELKLCAVVTHVYIGQKF